MVTGKKLRKRRYFEIEPKNSGKLYWIEEKSFTIYVRFYGIDKDSVRRTTTHPVTTSVLVSTTPSVPVFRAPSVPAFTTTSVPVSTTPSVHTSVTPSVPAYTSTPVHTSNLSSTRVTPTVFVVAASRLTVDC